jgi:hypothetical protein
VPLVLKRCGYMPELGNQETEAGKLTDRSVTVPKTPASGESNVSVYVDKPVKLEPWKLAPEPVHSAEILSSSYSTTAPTVAYAVTSNPVPLAYKPSIPTNSGASPALNPCWPELKKTIAREDSSVVDTASKYHLSKHQKKLQFGFQSLGNERTSRTMYHWPHPAAWARQGCERSR